MTDEQLPPPPIAPVPAPAPATAGSDWYTERIALLVSAAAIVAGSFGPWLVAQSGFGSIAANGMDGSDGQLTAVGGVLVAVFLFARKYIGAVVCGVVVTAIGVLDYFDVRDRIDSLDSDVVLGRVGWGLYAVLGGGLAATIFGVQCFRHGRETATHVEFAPPPTA